MSSISSFIKILLIFQEDHMRYLLLLAMLFLGVAYSVGSAPAQLSVNGTIAFAALGTDGISHIYTVTGTNSPVQLTSDSNGDQTPEWSPDGTMITFFRLLGTGSAAFVMNADGSNQQNLSPSPGLGDMLPSFSADGSKLIFMHIDSVGTCNNMPGGIPATTSIWSMSAVNGSNRTTLVNGASMGGVCFNAEPQANPSGKTMVWMCQPLNGSSQVCRSDIDGTGVGNLTGDPNGVIYGDPHWSPDGSKLVYSFKDTNNTVNIWVMNADGSNKRNLTRFTTTLGQSGHFGSDPGFAPNGTQIVFEHATNLGSPTAPASLAVINVDGTGYQNLGIACSFDGCGPRFQPKTRGTFKP
jgi:WD40-like Beta Propeller Repeat